MRRHPVGNNTMSVTKMQLAASSVGQIPACMPEMPYTGRMQKQERRRDRSECALN
jgi:hypothetical protein